MSVWKEKNVKMVIELGYNVQNMNYPKVSIVILNWNGWKDTIECLESLLCVKNIDFEVVIVDNGSSDNSIVEIDKWTELHGIPKFGFSQGIPQKLSVDESSSGHRGIQRIILFSLSENVGFCAGNNLGIRQAQINNIPYVLILNNDTIVEPDFLLPLVKYADDHPEAGLIGGQICYADEPQKIWWLGGKFSYLLYPKYLYQNEKRREVGSEPFSVDWISGCMMLMPLSVYSKIGGYDEKFFIWCDEWDLSLRVKMAGYELVVVPSSVIYHKIGKSLGKMSPLTYYYSGRNLLFLRRKYLPLWKQIPFFAFYLVGKFIKSIIYTIKFKEPYFIYYWDIVFDFVANRGGKWRHHDEVLGDK